ncbi:MAG: glycoside hydrolase family 25 protein [Clostridiales Family XIII bacterium]|nr:glycoside hydrolase family 25 protein [Clostridiales Family XIII bacterium]
MTTKDNRTKKRGGGLRVLVLIAVILVLAAAVYIVSQRLLADNGGRAGSGSLFFGGASTPTEEELEAQGWISPGALKAYAEEYNVNTEFLSRIFRDKIVYKRGGSILYEDIDPNLKKHPYDWDRLRWDERRPHYEYESKTEGGAFEAVLGIDVSRYQGDIDWKKVAADGVSFAMIRMGYRGYDTGRLVTDEFFEANMRGAADAGVKVGAYVFSQATNKAEAIEEAELVLTSVAPYKVTFPIVFDIEEISGQNARTDALTPAEITDIAIAFCERVAKDGYKPMIYANPKWFVSRMELDRLEPYDKWLAQYYKKPAFPYAFSMWQFTNTGAVDGINGDVDLDLAFIPK